MISIPVREDGPEHVLKLLIKYTDIKNCCKIRMKRFVRFDAQTLEYLKTFPTCPGIYLISCKDGTCYLGATKNLQSRIRSHLSHSGKFTGSAAHVIETLDEYCVKKLRALEDSYLAAFNFEHNSLVASPYSYTSKCK